MFFEAEFSQAVCAEVGQIIDLLQKSGKEGRADFCRRVKDAWFVMKGSAKKAKPSALTVDRVPL
jgi:hypothetical protein